MSKINTDRIGTRDGTLDIDVKSIMVRSDAMENLGDYEQGIELAHAHEFIVRGDSWYTAKTGQAPYVLTGVWEYDKERLEIYGAWDHSSLKNRNKEGSHSAGAIAYDHGSVFPDNSLGKELQTLKNNSSDYQIVDSFEQGATITERNQALQVEADGRLYRWAGDLPKTVAAGSSPESTGGAQVGAWLEVSDLNLRQDLANPDKGAAMVARSVVAVDSIADLLALPEGQRKEGLRYLVKGYYAGSDEGGGEFYWSPSKDKIEHDGGMVFDPDSLSAWSGSSSDLDTLFDWSGSGLGCFVRVSADASVRRFGASGDGIQDDARAFNQAISYIKKGTVFTRIRSKLIVEDGYYNLASPVDVEGAISVVGDSYAAKIFSTAAGQSAFRVSEKGSRFQNLAFTRDPNDTLYTAVPSELFKLGDPVAGTQTQNVVFKECFFESVGATNAIIENSLGYGTTITDCVFHNVRANTATVVYRQKPNELQGYSYSCQINGTDITRSFNLDGTYGVAILFEGGQLAIRDSVIESNDTSIKALRSNEQAVLILDKAYFENCQQWSIDIGAVNAEQPLWVGPSVQVTGGRFQKTGTGQNNMRLHGGAIEFHGSTIFQLIEYDTLPEAEIILGPGNSRWIYEKIKVSEGAAAQCVPPRMFDVVSSVSAQTELLGIQTKGTDSYELTIVHQNGFSGDNTFCIKYLVRRSRSGEFSTEIISSSRGASSVFALSYTFASGPNGSLLATPDKSGNWSYKVSR